MGILNFEMTNDDTTSESTSTGNTRTTDFVLSPGLPELREEDPSEDIDIDSPLSDDVFSVMDFNISPLIKQELRSTIRNKRIGSGMGDIVIDHSPRGSAELTPEEGERRLQRRERNRVAAIKCRGKRKVAAEALEQEWEAQDKLHAQLETEVEKLEAEKQKLLTLMQAHRPSCIIRRKDACMMQEASITTASQHDDHKYDGR